MKKLLATTNVVPKGSPGKFLILEPKQKIKYKKKTFSNDTVVAKGNPRNIFFWSAPAV